MRAVGLLFKWQRIAVWTSVTFVIGAFASSRVAFAQGAADVSVENQPSNTLVSTNEIGPTQLIGHSLQTPEAKRHIEQLIAEQKNESSGLHLDKEDSRLPPLVNGQYGFTEPPKLEGVPKAFVNLGQSSTYAFVVEKLHHRLTVFKVTQDHSYEAVRVFRAITGKDPNDKVERGDLRTPEGIYFVTGQIDGKQLPPKYGRLAFTLDYPNIYDQRKRKSGYGIWIHATDDPQRLLKPFDTQGCVAMSNEDIVELAKYIVPFETPVVITKEMTTAPLAEVVAPRKPAMDMIDGWRKSWQESRFDDYMSYYSKDFRSLGRNKNQWRNYKNVLSEQRNKEITVTISEPKILAFEDQLLVTFLQDYSSEQHADFGRKFLYLQWEGDRYRIIAEKWYPVKKTETANSLVHSADSQM